MNFKFLHLFHKWRPVKDLGELKYFEWFVVPWNGCWTKRYHVGYECSICGARKIKSGVILKSELKAEKEAYDWLNEKEGEG